MFNPMAPYMQQTGLPSPQMPGFQMQQPGQMFPPYQQQMLPIKQQAFDWIRVNTLDDVKNVSVQPGGKAWIMLQNDPVFVVKTADAMGLATTQAFRFEPYNPEEAQAEQYAPLGLVQQVQAQIQQLSDEINALRGGVTRGKSVKQSVSGTASAE